ncbi:MFS transporter [Pseudoduganella sp. UC29_106]|uniref:MFS transporter n=1 Tax=Pseudoduganella sp. UC29_106 TaxID=3374553 RepID=UPI0037584095
MVGSNRARTLGKRFIMLDSALVVAGFNVVFPLIGLHFVDQLGWAAAAVGLALGVRQVSQQGLALFGGSLTDRFGGKPLIVLGMLLRASGFALMGFAATPMQLMVSLVLSGLGGSLFDPARGALVVKLVRPSERPRFYSRLIMQECVAGVLGALLGTFLLGFDFRWTALGGCALFVLAALANAVLLPSYRTSTPGTSAFTAMRTPLRDKPFVSLVLTLSGYYVLQTQLMLGVPVLLMQLSGSAQSVAWMYAMEAVLAVSLLYPMARLAERHFSLESRLTAGVAVMACSIALLSLARGTFGVFAVVAVFYIGSLFADPAREALVARFAQARVARASYIGLSRFGLALGGLFGYTASGYLIDRARALNMPALPWLVLSSIGFVTVFALAWQFAPRAKLRLEKMVS